VTQIVLRGAAAAAAATAAATSTATAAAVTVYPSPPAAAAIGCSSLEVRFASCSTNFPAITVAVAAAGGRGVSGLRRPQAVPQEALTAPAAAGVGGCAAVPAC
jgi:hypothetical protein